MKIKTRAAIKMFVAIFAQDRLELIVDCFNIWTFVDKERNIHDGDNLNGNIQTRNINHDNLNNNEVVEINNATNSCQNNQNENQEYFYWNDVAGMQYANKLTNTYEKIGRQIYWKGNLFMLPSGATGKNYIGEVTRLMKLWINDTPL